MLYMFQAVSPFIIRSSKTVNTTSVICHACMLLPLTWVSWKLTHVSGRSKQAWHIPDVVRTVFELLMIGEETA